MKIEKIGFDKNNIYVVVDTGHTIGNPVAWFDRSHKATCEQRTNYEIGPTGESLHGAELDEDLSLESFLVSGVS